MEVGRVWGTKLSSALVARSYNCLSRACGRSLRDRLWYPIGMRIWDRLDGRIRGRLWGALRMVIDR